ncbi:MAG: outer membrane lipoprotein carrier protein LolA [Jatrophihabitans sp.]|uniref:LolA family protein n=1 Tax=Jatrophihabitans sp. TaxID=1932789 RepID=UPI0039102256
MARSRALRWLAPVGVAGVAALAATGAFSASASSDDLPATTPAALIAAVQTSGVGGFSGTVVSHLSLGLPDLPAIGTSDEPSSFASLLTGSHTMQVWYGGLGKQRVALLGATDETDLFRNGTDVWQWSSADQLAVHSLLPADAPTAAPLPSSTSSLTPGDLARDALHALDPTTRVAIEGNHTVADRSAYELVLTPRTTATKVGSVHISVDGETKIPLGVQVYARDASAPAVDVAFTSIRFGTQAERNFVFSPPANATVHEAGSGRRSAEPRADAGRGTKPRTTGSGWARVVALDPGPAAVAKLLGPASKALTPVTGAWGKGRLLESALVSVLVTADGRLYAGAVDPESLYAAAGSR